MRRVLLVLALTACHSQTARPEAPARTYTRDDLASPDPAVRDAAAAAIKASWQSPPREPWDELVAGIHEGDPLDSVKAKLPDAEDGATGFGCSGGGCGGAWQLDDRWALDCGWLSENDTIIQCEVVSMTRAVFVDHPPGYTGTWTEYFVSGAPRVVTHYKDGKEVGTTTVYQDDGRLEWVFRYDDNGVRLEEIGYWTGTDQMSHQGLYTDGKQSGVWTFYNQDGSVNFTTDYSTTP